MKCLIQRDGKRIIALPESLKTVGDWAFEDCFALKEIYVPAGVTAIGDGAFGYYYVEEGDVDLLLEGFLLVGETGSAAETYATENGITFQTNRVEN